MVEIGASYITHYLILKLAPHFVICLKITYDMRHLGRQIARDRNKLTFALVTSVLV